MCTRAIHSDRPAMTTSRAAHKIVLATSNVAYLAPAVVVVYKAAKGQLPWHSAFQIAGLCVFVTFVASWSYHSSRCDLSASDTECRRLDSHTMDHAPTQTHVSWLENLPGSTERISLRSYEHMDHFFAVLTATVTMAHCAPLSDAMRSSIIVGAVAWIAVFCAVINTTMLYLPILLLLLFLCFFWARHRRSSSQTASILDRRWGASAALAVLSFVFLHIDKRPYWLKHSLWHIFSAGSMALLIAGSSTETMSLLRKIPTDDRIQ